MEQMLSTLRVMLDIRNEDQDALLRTLLTQAEQEALAITGRSVLPEGLRGAVTDLAVMRYNRRGCEGEASRTEGGVTTQMEALPENIRRQLRRYTLAQAGVKKCGVE